MPLRLSRENRQKWLQRAAYLVPRRLGRLPYTACLYAIRGGSWRMGRNRPAVWARGSYALGTLRPPLSDLDLTFWFERQPEPLEIEQVTRLLKWARLLFPRLGEAGVFAAQEACSFSAFANHFELERDPILAKRLAVPGRLPARVEAAVFLLRLLESDWHNLGTCQALRRSKWDSHLASIESELGDIRKDRASGDREYSVSTLVELVVLLLELNKAEDATGLQEAIPAFLDAKAKGIPLHQVRMNAWWWLVFPHRFCFRTDFPKAPAGEFATELEPETAGRLLQLFAAQVSWEIWGLYSQFRLVRDHRQLSAHLGNLRKIVEEASVGSSFVDRERLLAGLVRLENALHSYSQAYSRDCSGGL